MTVIDHAVPPPSQPRSLEVRTSGLWADHHCETPVDHWSLALEAFALTLDDPADALVVEPLGRRTPLGLDLEWEQVAAVADTGAGDVAYEVPCHVHGEVLVGAERLALDGWGVRSHRWGVCPLESGSWTWSAWRDGQGRWTHPGMRPVGPLESLESLESLGVAGSGDLRAPVVAPPGVAGGDGSRPTTRQRGLHRRGLRGIAGGGGAGGTGWWETGEAGERRGP